MVTSNELLFFLIQAVFLSKRRDFRECIIMSMSRSVILVCCLAKVMASVHRGPAQSVWVADCYFIVNVLDLPFASPIVVNRQLCI